MTPRLRTFLIFAVSTILYLIYGAAMAHGQATIPVSGVKVHDSSMSLLTGHVVFTVTDGSDNPVTYTPQGGSPTMATFTIQVIAGAVQNASGFPPTIANPATMSPTGTRYRIQVQNSASSTTYYTLPLTPVTGASYSLDSYQVPANVTVTGLGLPNLACAPTAMYNDTTASNPYPWVCSYLSDSGSNYWTQNPSRNPVCQYGNQAAVAPINGGNVFCIPSTQAYATPGFMLGSPSAGAAPGVVALVATPSSSTIAATTGLLKGTAGGNQAVQANLADVSATIQSGSTHCTDPTKAYSPASADCIATGGAVPGSNQQVVFNNAGAFGAVAGFTFDGTNLAVPTVVTPVISTSGTSATMKQTGDQYGATSFALENRDGLNGLKLTNSGLDLVDFAFTGTSGYQHNIRGNTLGFTNGYNNQYGEFDFTLNTNGTGGHSSVSALYLGYATTQFYPSGTGNVTIGYSGTHVPSAMLDVNGSAKVTSLTCTSTPCGSGALPSSSNGVIYTDTSGVVHAGTTVTTDGSNLNVGGAVFMGSATGGTAIWNNSARALDEKSWDALNFDSSLYFRARSDDGATTNNWLKVDRTGKVPTLATFNESVTATGTLTGGNIVSSSQDTTPGYNVGGCVGIGPCNWYGKSGVSNTFISFSQGIKDGYSLDDFECLGAGDCNVFGAYPKSAAAATKPADEGTTIARFGGIIGTSDQKGHVNTGGGGANATQVSLSDHTGGAFGVGRPIIDTTDDVLSLTLSGCVSVTGPVGSAQTDTAFQRCTTSVSVPVSAPFTFAQDVAPPTDSSFPQTSETFNINTTTTLSVGDLLSIGGMHPETTRTTAVGTPSGGVQSVTALLRYAHFSGTVAYANHAGVGMGGRWAEYTAQTTANNAGAKITAVVIGSPDATHIDLFSPVTGSMDPLGLGNGVVNIYHGAYLTDIRDSTGVVGSPSNGYHYAMEDNDAAWSNGAGIEVTQEVNQTWKGVVSVMDVYNPLARGHIVDMECDAGSYACGNWWTPGNTGLMYFRNANPLSMYSENSVAGGTAGQSYVGRIFDFAGPWGTFAYFSDARVKPLFEFQHTDYGVNFAQFDDAQGGWQFVKTGNTWNILGDSINLIGGSGGTSNTSVTVQGDLFIHPTSVSPNPCTVGAAGGTGTTSCTVTGSRTQGTVSVTTGTSPTTGTLVTITQNLTLPSAPNGCTVTARNAATSAINSGIYVPAPTTTTITLGLGSSLLAAATTYTWAFSCF